MDFSPLCVSSTCLWTVYLTRWPPTITDHLIWKMLSGMDSNLSSTPIIPLSCYPLIFGSKIKVRQACLPQLFFGFVKYIYAYMHMQMLRRQCCRHVLSRAVGNYCKGFESETIPSLLSHQFPISQFREEESDQKN